MSKYLVVALIGFALLIPACSKKASDVLQVSGPLPSGVVKRDAPLVITFSRGIVKPDSTNQWTSTPYIHFTPDIPGKFTWRDTSTLIFSPDAILPGDTKFTAKLNADLLASMSGAKGFSGDESFTFGTESFMMTKAEFFYDRIGQSRTVGIKANLEFTYAANPAEVVKHLKVTIDNQPVQPNAVSTQNSSVIPVEIGTTVQLEKEKAVSLTFDDGLVSSETNTHITTIKPFVYQVPGLEEVKIYGHDFGSDGSNGWITVRTSQQIDLASAKSFITVDPVHDFTLLEGSGGFTIKGKFTPGSTFHLAIKKGMESVLGSKTQNDYEADILVGNIAPTFGFASESGNYLLLNGAKKIGIKTTNYSKLFFRVSQVFQNNLVHFIDEGRTYGGYYNDEGDGDEGGGEEGYAYSRPRFRYVIGNNGRQLKADTLFINSVTNREVTTEFDLAPYLNNGYKGFYVIEIADPNKMWETTAKLISVSNIGIIVKQSPDQVMAFVTSLETNLPLPGAAVNLISYNNQTILSAKSDQDGVARFDDFLKARKDFYLKLVTAELDNDFNYINFDDYRVETSRFQVEGKRDAENGFDAMLYGDRPIYRPGEKIYVSGILRNIGNALPAGQPVRLKLYNPRGTMVNETQHTLNDEGSFETSYQTSSTGLTGTYRFVLSTGNDRYLADYNVSVEDFVPDRMRIHLNASTDKASPGDKITYKLEALNFFGPPAAERNYEFEGTFENIPYLSKSFPDFWFADRAAKNYSANPVVATGKTDKDGKATAALAIPDDATSQGLLRARGRVAVFDESGRPVYQVAQTTVYPKPYLIGLRNYGPYYVNPNAPQKLQIVAVDKSDKPISGFRARVDLVRFEWQSVLRQSGTTGTLRYVSERKDILVGSDTITLAGKPYDYTYAVTRSGDYAVRVGKIGDDGYNQISFYSYDWATAGITSFPVNAEAHVEIVFDKEKYAPGDLAHVLFQAPFSGKMLVTVERNRVFTYKYLDVVNNAASIDIPVDEKFLPNAYVSCVLFRKIKEMNIPLLAGHGFKPLMVERSSNQLVVAIKSPDKIRPKTRQSVTVSVSGVKDACLTIAAVDEGILQLKNYKTPDPYGYFYAKKALETMTYDFFRSLLPEKSSIGGSEAQAAKRVNPLGVQRFKPLAIWSGIRRTNDNGDAEFSFDVPEFNGELRIMAFVYKGDKFGSAEKPMKVADPIVLTPALPRFASANDTIAMTLTAFNTTEKPAKLSFNVETAGGIVVAGDVPSLDVAANQEKYVNVTLRTTNQIGKATVKVSTSAFGETFSSATDLPVRPISPFTSDAVTGFVEGGSSAVQDVGDVYLQYNRKSYITLSPYPVANFAKELKYLVGYPHGCIEQTVSKAFPQIYLRDIATMLDPTILNTGSPTYFVNEAITKVTSMQLPDGSFSYWPGGTDRAYDWATIYAAHFLLEARKAGYAVQENVVKSAMNALASIARNRNVVDIEYYGVGQKVTIRRIADKAALYALYVLALGGAPEKNVMNYYRTERSLLTPDTQYLLAGAFGLSGDRRAFLELQPPEFASDEVKRQMGGCFDSPIRANALILNVLLDIDLDNPKVPIYMDYLSKTYRRPWWFSTQDDAFTLLAFGKAARMASATKVSGTIDVGGKQYSYAGGNQKIDIDPYGKKVTISIAGTGRVYYSLVTEGIRTDGKVRVEDKGLQIRREFLDRNGNPVNLAGIRQNDLVIVKLVLNSSVNSLENVAITDLLPAGFEIENPRVTEKAGGNYQFLKNASQPEYLDVRDDRINFYTGLGRQAVFYYMVRAVTPGTFTYAPVVAEAMYDANYYSAAGQMRLKIGR